MLSRPLALAIHHKRASFLMFCKIILRLGEAPSKTQPFLCFQIHQTTNSTLMPSLAPPFSKDSVIWPRCLLLQTNLANHACITSSKILHTQHVCPHLHQSISNLDPLELHIHDLMQPSCLDIALLKSCYSPMAEDGNDFLGCDETLMNFQLK